MEKGPLLPAEHAPLVNGRIWMVICGQLRLISARRARMTWAPPTTWCSAASPDDHGQFGPLLNQDYLLAGEHRLDDHVLHAGWQGRVSGGDHTRVLRVCSKSGTCCGW